MTFIRAYPLAIDGEDDFAVQLAKRMRQAYIETVEAVGAPDPEFPTEYIPEFSARWWKDQETYHIKWAGDRIPEAAEKKIRNIAHCQSLIKHCDGCDNPRTFDGLPVYCSRSYFDAKVLAPLPCPKTYEKLMLKKELEVALKRIIKLMETLEYKEEDVRGLFCEFRGSAYFPVDDEDT